jgi:two-component system, NtrC family, nitrogen regulation response regulator GlnG
LNKTQSAESNVRKPSDFVADLVLVVDDEPSICWGLERLLRGEGHHVVTASSAEEGLEIASERKPALVLLDVRLPREDGISALPKFRERTGDAPVVVMTAFGDLQTAIAAVQNGASDYLTKPFKLEDAARVVRSNLQAAHARRNSRGEQKVGGVRDLQIVGSSAAIQRAFRQIALVASSELSVLITGETGTGKELVADAIHRHSPRSERPYVAIAPVALNADLIESELFGHVKGAFTGATENRVGLFEQAEGGTVLLDEIGELPLAVQAKLLRVLEKGEYFRVGEITPRRCNVRILAATNCDLHHSVLEQRFREDLYYRLNGMHIHLPPLRERSEDIGLLCQYFLERCEYRGPHTLEASLVEALMALPWYGNVRELRNAIEHATVLARGRALQLEDFPAPRGFAAEAGTISLAQATEVWARKTIRNIGSESSPLHSQFLAATEPILLKLALEHSGGNRANAAELLGIHRGTLRDRLRAYGMDEQ